MTHSCYILCMQLIISRCADIIYSGAAYPAESNSIKKRKEKEKEKENQELWPRESLLVLVLLLYSGTKVTVQAVLSASQTMCWLALMGRFSGYPLRGTLLLR
jgi:hypothetical protein